MDKYEPGSSFEVENNSFKVNDSDSDVRNLDNLALKIEGIRIIVSVILFILSFIIDEKIGDYLLFGAYIISGYEIIWTAVKNIFRGEVFDENFLMTLATVGAFAIGEYKEAVGVMLFYMIGEFFQDLAVDRSKKSIKDLINLRPDYANILKEDGRVTKVSPETIRVGDLLLVKQGERIPVDSIVVEGFSSLDVKALTGESLPKDVDKNDEVISGSVNLTSTLKLKANKVYKESTVSRIMDLVEESSSHKAETEKFITRFARVYTPVVVILALIVAFIVPLVIQEPINLWIRKALIFLVISCPCALVLSIPLGFFGGLGLASKNGILIKGSNHLENLKDLKYVVMDKTGTVTEGNFKVTEVRTDIDKEEFLKITALTEMSSPHPIAKSVVKNYDGTLNEKEIRNSTEIKGKGIKTELVDGRIYYAGTIGLIKELDINVPSELESSEGIHFAQKNDEKSIYLGSLVIEDIIKKDSKSAVERLKKLGIKTYMLSGDNEKTVKKIADIAGIEEYKGNLLPQDKVSELKNIMEKTKGKVAFTGDGLNDTPVLKTADIGISMGQMGSDAAIEASDIVIAKDSLMKIPDAIKISKMTLNTVNQNIVLSLGIKAVVMLQSIFFKENIWLAIFADVGVALIAVLNSALLTRKRV